uniref:RUN and FYVE domain-containing protein 4 n=2 Tax=Catharus TaxID=9184 RepID=A0A8C3TT46_CATUS
RMREGAMPAQPCHPAETIAKLKCNYQEKNLPVTDGSRELHSLCAQLEFLLQFDLKEKRSFFGQRKDYWDFLCQGLARCRQEHEGIHFVTSLDKLKTPVGRGRAFLRYCLVHQQLAESLQLCLLDPESLCEWYYARSPFLSPKQRAEILGSLYELDCVTFHLTLHRDDLDTAWPMFSEPLVRPSPVIRSSPAKTALQTVSIGTAAHGWSDGICHPTVALRGTPARLCPPTLAALQAGNVEIEDIKRDVEDGEVKKDMEEEDEEGVEKDDSEDTKEVKVDVEKDMEEDLEEKDEELEEDEKEMKDVDVQELEDKASQPDGAGEPGTRCMLGSLSLVPRQPAGTEESLQALVSQLRAELAQREVAAQALAVRLAQAELRHQRQEEDSAQLWAREAEALRETNTFLEQALEAAGDPGALARAQEEARRWQEVAEERGTQLARVQAEAAALTSRLQECQEALVAAGQTDMLKDAGASDELAAVEKVLQQALELARGPQEPPPSPQAEGEPSTITSMAMVWGSPRGSRGGVRFWGLGLSPHSPPALGQPGRHSTGGDLAEPAAAPGPATGDGTAAGGAQQVGQGPLLPPPNISYLHHEVSPGAPKNVLLGHNRTAAGDWQGWGGKDLWGEDRREGSIWD